MWNWLKEKLERIRNWWKESKAARVVKNAAIAIGAVGAVFFNPAAVVVTGVTATIAVAGAYVSARRAKVPFKVFISHLGLSAKIIACRENIPACSVLIAAAFYNPALALLALGFLVFVAVGVSATIMYQVYDTWANTSSV